MYKVSMVISAACLVSASALWACKDDNDNNSSSSSNTATGGSSGAQSSSNAGQSGANARAGSGGTAGSSRANGGNGGTNTAGTMARAGTGGANPTGTTRGGTGGHGGAGGVAEGSDAGISELTDAQIASVGVTANMGEIEQSMVALDRAKRDDVRAFAGDMVAMHNAALTRENALATALNLKPEDNPVSQDLKAQSDQIVQKLKAASDAQFDSVFMQSQVDVHDAVLKLIDGTLLPHVQNTQLKDELNSMHQTVMMHLTQARELNTMVQSSQ